MADTKPNTITVKDGRLIIDVALEEGGHLSGSGKNRVFFTTGGNVDCGAGYKIGINLYAKA